MVAKSILETIGNTPMVGLTHIDTVVCRLFIKLENQNPGGSIKDRVGFSMINEAERLGKLPSLMTHSSIAKKVREKIGITDTLIRVSVGIEGIHDLIADLEQALE